MSEYKFVCDSCKDNFEMENRKELLGVSVCPECYKMLTNIMSYKNYKDINENERVCLQNFLNKLCKISLTSDKNNV